MYKLRVNSDPTKTDLEAEYRDAHPWWQNFCRKTDGGTFSRWEYLFNNHGGNYKVGNKEWCIEFASEEDAIMFVLKFS